MFSIIPRFSALQSFQFFVDYICQNYLFSLPCVPSRNLLPTDGCFPSSFVGKCQGNAKALQKSIGLRKRIEIRLDNLVRIMIFGRTYQNYSFETNTCSFIYQYHICLLRYPVFKWFLKFSMDVNTIFFVEHRISCIGMWVVKDRKFIEGNFPQTEVFIESSESTFSLYILSGSWADHITLTLNWAPSVDNISDWSLPSQWIFVLVRQETVDVKYSFRCIGPVYFLLT